MLSASLLSIPMSDADLRCIDTHVHQKLIHKHQQNLPVSGMCSYAKRPLNWPAGWPTSQPLARSWEAAEISITEGTQIQQAALLFGNTSEYNQI